jgi:hypothetical protein
MINIDRVPMLAEEGGSLVLVDEPPGGQARLLGPYLISLNLLMGDKELILYVGFLKERYNLWVNKLQNFGHITFLIL